MEVRERRAELDAVGARCIAVGFSPPAELSRLVESLEWPWPFLADEKRAVYARLDVRRATLRNVYTATTVWRYVRAAARGVRLHLPVEDTRQLGADAVIRRGRAVWVHRPLSPDDRPSVDVLIDALLRAAREAQR